jgi:hypothetical protein
MTRYVQAWCLGGLVLAVAACDSGHARSAAAVASITPTSAVAVAPVAPAVTTTTATSDFQPSATPVITTPLRAGAGQRRRDRAATGASPGGGLAGHSGLGLTGSFPSDDVLAAGEHGASELGHLRR